MRAKIENPDRLSTVVGLVDRWQAAGVGALSDALGIRAYEQSDLRPRRFATGHPNHTAAQRLSSINRLSQPLAGAMTRFKFMKQFSMVATLAPASGGSAVSR